MKTGRSSEPIWWLLFAVGGTVAAFLVPVHIAVGGIAGPAGWIPQAFAYDRMVGLISHPLSRLYLFALISLSLFHWAHRFRYTLAEGLRLKASWLPIPIACYGSAIVGTILAAAVLMRL
ncbi:MAG: fumarate reductase subunit D [Armatimonadetes bacterium]|nr:fumarate reductase subunit D [Armatimonadota bacterium]